MCVLAAKAVFSTAPWNLRTGNRGLIAALMHVFHLIRIITTSSLELPTVEAVVIPMTLRSNFENPNQSSKGVRAQQEEIQVKVIIQERLTQDPTKNLTSKPALDKKK